MVKMISTVRIINTILLNIKVNQPKLVNVFGYKLETKRQNFTEMYSPLVKIRQKVLGGYFFDLHCIYVARKWSCMALSICVVLGILK